MDKTSEGRFVAGLYNAPAAGAADFVKDFHNTALLDFELGQKAITNLSRINKVLTATTRFLGVTSMVDHGLKAYNAYKKDGWKSKELWTNVAKIGLDAIFTFGKASNPFILFGGIAYSILDMTGQF